MKKTLLIIALAISCYSLKAQYGPKVQFGLKAGLNIANMTDRGKSVYGYYIRPSLDVGALVNIKFNGSSSGFALQPEFVFSGQGGMYNSDGINNYFGSGNNEVTDLKYINIPILLQYQFRNGFRLETGPQFGFLIDAHDDLQGNVKKYYNSTDFGWAFGLGYMWRGGFGVDARANLGLSNINADKTPGYNENMNNQVIQFGAFYQFGNNYYHSKSH